VCPRCGAPNPTLGYNVTKPIAIAVSVIIVLSIVADVLHSRKPRYVAGRTYPIAKNGLVCLTLNGLAKAHEHRVTLDQAEQLGCLPLAPEQHPQVRILDSAESAVKVLVFAPKLKVDNFQGWMAVDNLDPNSIEAP
jgi:hypothetical protein